jgi:hypothetical protein
MTYTMTSQNIDLSFWDILYSVDYKMKNVCWAVSGMRTGGVDRSTWKKSASVTFYPQHIPHDLNRLRLNPWFITFRTINFLLSPAFPANPTNHLVLRWDWS